MNDIAPSPPKVMPLTNRVTTSSTVSCWIRPSSASRLVIMPIARTAGTVKPMVDKAGPRQILMDRCRRFDRAAEKALKASGVGTKTANSQEKSSVDLRWIPRFDIRSALKAMKTRIVMPPRTAGAMAFNRT